MVVVVVEGMGGMVGGQGVVVVVMSQVQVQVMVVQVGHMVVGQVIVVVAVVTTLMVAGRHHHIFSFTWISYHITQLLVHRVE